MVASPPSVPTTSAPTSADDPATTNASPDSSAVVLTSTAVVQADDSLLGAKVPPNSGGSPPTPIDSEATPLVRHLDHSALESRLPGVGDLSWLPPDATFEDDSDLTSRLAAFNCSGTRSDVASRQASATNRQYFSGQASLASITFYDVETVDDARAFMSGLNSVFSCPSPPSSVVTFEAVALDAPTQCDAAVVVRTYQPVSETIDAWCQVVNLIAWIRLYPTGLIASETDSTAPAPIPPTDNQAGQTMIATAAALRAAWDAAS